MKTTAITPSANYSRAPIKTLRELAALKGKMLYIENFSVGAPYLKQQLVTEKSALQEKVIDGKWEALAIIRKVPVTRFVLNLNDRIYPRELWLIVKEKNAAEGTYCLSDHPEGDLGSTGKIAGVWHNFVVGEDMAYGDLYILDNENGRSLLAAIKAGGMIGMSSVGFGEFLDDGKTINPQTFELVRLGDWVLDPSQQTFATLETSEVVSDPSDSAAVDPKQEQTTPATTRGVTVIAEQTQTQSSAVQQNSTTQSTNLTTQQKENKSMMDKIEESNFRNRVLTAVSKARKGDNLIESRQELENYLSAMPAEAGFADIRTRVQEALSYVDTQLESTVQTQAARTAILEKENTELRGMLATAAATIGKLKEAYGKARNVAIAIDKAVKEGKHPVVRVLRSNIAILESNEADMKDDLEQYEADMQAMEADLDQYETDMQAMEADMAADAEKDKEKTESVRKTQAAYARMKRRVEAMTRVILSARNGKAVLEAIEAEVNIDPTGGMDIPDDNMGASSPTATDGTEDPNADAAGVAAGLRAENLGQDGSMNQNFAFDQTDDVRDPSQQYAQPAPGTIGEELDPMMGDMTLQPTGGMDPAFMPQESDDDVIDPMEDPAQKQEKALRTSLTQYYLEQARLFPAVHDIKVNILGAKSLTSAVKMVETFLQQRSPANAPARGTTAGIKTGFMLEQNSGKKPAWLKGNRI